MHLELAGDLRNGTYIFFVATFLYYDSVKDLLYGFEVELVRGLDVGGKRLL